MNIETLKQLAKQYGIPETEDIRDCIVIPQSEEDWFFYPLIQWIKAKIKLA
jgi:hypothetical protein